MKPSLLLDVDGVLCPFPPDEPEGYVRHEVGSGTGGWVWVSSANECRLKELQRHFDLVWATAWEDNANEELLEVHGLEDPLPVISFKWPQPSLPDDYKPRLSDVKSGYNTWKLPWIIQWADEKGVPMAWVDDDIHDEAVRWAKSREIPALFIRVDPHIGLTDEHVRALIEFAESNV